MRKYIVIAIVIIAVPAIVLVSARINPPHKQERLTKDQSTLPARKKLTQAEFESQFPIVEYSASESDTTTANAKRVDAEKKYKSGQLPISEYSETIVTHTNWEVGLPALPVLQSQAVVLGSVTHIQAHLTGDKAVVYSEFSIQINEVFSDNGQTLTPNVVITVTRAGGRVRFSSGHVTLQAIVGQNIPRVGKTYVFFLTREDQEEDFHILTGYEFRAARVYPLDNPQGGMHPIATTYNGVEQELFLTDLRTTLNNTLKSSIK